MIIYLPIMLRDNYEIPSVFIAKVGFLSREAAADELAAIKIRIARIQSLKEMLVIKESEHYADSEPIIIGCPTEGLDARIEKRLGVWMRFRRELGLKENEFERYPDIFDLSEHDLFGELSFDIREIEVK